MALFFDLKANCITLSAIKLKQAIGMSLKLWSRRTAQRAGDWVIYDIKYLMS